MPVVAIWCVLLAGLLWAGAGGSPSEQDDSKGLDAADHYNLAVVASSNGEFALAVSHLEQFCSSSSEQLGSPAASERRWQALFHLAELYIHTNHSDKALASLLDAIELDLELESEQAKSLDAAELGDSSMVGMPSLLATFDGQTHPNIERWALIAEHAAMQLVDSPSAISMIAEYRAAVSDARTIGLDQLPRWREHREQIEYEYGRRLEATGRVSEALACYRELIGQASLAYSTEPTRGLDVIERWQRAYVRCCLKLAQDAREFNQHLVASQALQQLRREAWLPAEHRQAIVFAQVDQLAAIREFAAALSLLDDWQSSVEQAHSRIADEAGENSTPEAQVDLLGNIALRRSELFAATDRKSEALHLVLTAIEQFPSYQCVAELHYLAGRILVSRAAFDEARWHFSAAFKSPRATSEQQGRALWMIGETFFLQQNHSAAIDAYRRLSALGIENSWYVRGVVQTAKCLELQGLPEEALNAYQSFVAHCNGDHNFSDELEIAGERIRALTSTAPLSRSQTSQREAAQRTR